MSVAAETDIILTTRALPLSEVDIGGLRMKLKLFDAAAAVESKVLVSTSLDPIDAAMIARLPAGLGLIANIGVGTDNIDLVAAAARGIEVSNTPVVTEDTADLAFALILAASRKIGMAERFTRSGAWSDGKIASPVGVRVHGKTLGLIGFGAIGQAVARRARGFNMKIVWFNRSAPKSPIAGAERLGSIEAVIEASDIVSLHLPLTPETRGVINADRLARFQPGAIFVNTARGPLVDEAALAERVRAGALAAVGLDVFNDEPRINDALLACNNAVLLPHIGSATQECRAEMVGRCLQNVGAFLQIGRALDVV